MTGSQMLLGWLCTVLTLGVVLIGWAMALSDRWTAKYGGRRKNTSTTPGGVTETVDPDGNRKVRFPRREA